MRKYVEAVVGYFNTWFTWRNWGKKEKQKKSVRITSVETGIQTQGHPNMGEWQPLTWSIQYNECQSFFWQIKVWYYYMI